MPKLFRLGYSAYRYLAAAASRLQPVILLLVRLYWGWAFFLSGKGKLLNLGRTAEFFQSLGLPLPTFQAFLAGSTECFCGFFLLVGLASRLISIPLIITMVVAYLASDFDKVKSIISEPDKFVTADPFLFMMAALIVFIFGPGKASLDHLIRHLFFANEDSRQTEGSKPVREKR